MTQAGNSQSHGPLETRIEHLQTRPQMGSGLWLACIPGFHADARTVDNKITAAAITTSAIVFTCSRSTMCPAVLKMVWLLAETCLNVTHDQNMPDGQVPQKEGQHCIIGSAAELLHSTMPQNDQLSCSDANFAFKMEGHLPGKPELADWLSLGPVSLQSKGAAESEAPRE